MATDKSKRIPGQATYASNFEVQKQALLDAREVILGSAADLVNPKTWEDEDGNVWLAKGLKVAVMNGGGTPELYILKDPDKYTEAASWVKIGDMAGATPLVLDLSEVEQDDEMHDNIDLGISYDEISAVAKSGRLILVTFNGQYFVVPTNVTVAMPNIALYSVGANYDMWVVTIAKGTNANTCKVGVGHGPITKAAVGLGNVTNDAQVKRSEMGKANGVATLGADGKVPVEQLPQLDTSLYLPVAELPTEDIKTDKIYLVPATDTAEDNIYDEYLYVEGKWEKFGSVQAKADLSGYYTKTEADGKFATKTVASSSADGLMSKTDKAKLDALPAGSEVVTSVVLEVEAI